MSVTESGTSQHLERFDTVHYDSQAIEEYYLHSQFDYRLLWNQDESHSLHFGFWSDETRNLSEALENENRVLADLAQIQPGDVVLDAGCGVGGSSIFLAQNFGCQVHGVSLCSHQLTRAQEVARKYNVENQVHFSRADFHDLDFSDSFFSVIWCIESFCHSWNKPRFLEEAFRLLRPGGVLIIADGFLGSRMQRPSERRLMRSWLDGWAVPELLSQTQIGALASDAGFRDSSFEDYTEKIRKSSERLYRYSTILSPAARFASFLGLRRKILNGNLRAARDQYLALRADLWQYGVFRAWK
ncbi:MAG TPA: hypothetical protein DEA96_17260 [Leptospiraceae bacterium]|nr:hypothetical protein [Spirochaetaceae bacterium]HBS06721.1 hypothetical protein [Leptospiraceae bacterium]|tara:strand:+ start:56396 stop:57292 length:897 start_codon:yes stop_codon:yes gene_type:complete